jgi:hypothetical protein
LRTRCLRCRTAPGTARDARARERPLRQVALTIAISTTLISYLRIFPAPAVLRRKYAAVPRPFGTLGVVVLLAAVGDALGAPVRGHAADVVLAPA